MVERCEADAATSLQSAARRRLARTRREWLAREQLAQAGAEVNAAARAVDGLVASVSALRLEGSERSGETTAWLTREVLEHRSQLSEQRTHLRELQILLTVCRAPVSAHWLRTCAPRASRAFIRDGLGLPTGEGRILEFAAGSWSQHQRPRCMAMMRWLAAWQQVAQQKVARQQVAQQQVAQQLAARRRRPMLHSLRGGRA